MIIHPSVTLKRVVEAVEQYHASLDNPGICISCGADHNGCEPDACEYECEHCGQFAVYGAEELLMMIA